MKTETLIDYETVEKKTEVYVCERCDEHVGPVDETTPIAVSVDPHIIYSEDLHDELHRQICRQLQRPWTQRVTADHILSTVKSTVTGPIDSAHTEWICEQCAEDGYDLDRDPIGGSDIETTEDDVPDDIALMDRVSRYAFILGVPIVILSIVITSGGSIFDMVTMLVMYVCALYAGKYLL